MDLLSPGKRTKDESIGKEVCRYRGKGGDVNIWCIRGLHEVKDGGVISW